MKHTHTSEVEKSLVEVCFCGNRIYRDSIPEIYLPFYFNYDFFNYETYLEYELEGIPYRFCSSACLHDFFEILTKLEGAEKYNFREGSRSGGRPVFAVLDYGDHYTTDIREVYQKHKVRFEIERKKRENKILKTCMKCDKTPQKDYLLLKTGSRICSQECFEEIISEVAEFEMSENEDITDFDYELKKGDQNGIPIEIKINYYETEKFLYCRQY